MRQRSATFLVAMLVLVGLLAGGCGSGDSSSSTASDPSSYASDVVDIMQPLSADLQQAGDDATNASSEDDVVAALDDSEGVLSDSVDQLQALTPPEEVADLHEQLIAEIQSYLQSVTQTSAAFTDAASNAEITQAGKTFMTDSQEFADNITDLLRQFNDAGIPFQDQS
jgi:hypothetical protein